MGWDGTEEAYLEPLLARAIARLEVRPARVHPHHDGALCVCPLLPVRAHFAAGSDLSGEVGRGTAVAHDLLVCHGHGGVVVGPLPLDGLRACGWSEAFVAVESC